MRSLLYLLFLVVSSSEENCETSCRNRGLCVGENICLCDATYSGGDCSTRVCTSTFCLNGGTCIMNFGNLECRCPANISGPQCEFGFLIPSESSGTVPTGPPLNVRGVGVSPFSIAVAWDEVAVGERNGEIVSYKVQYRQVAASSPTTRLNTTSRLAFLTDLLAQTQYSITVLAFTEDGGGPESHTLLVETLSDDAPTDSPLDLAVTETTVSPVSSTELNVTWTEVSPQDHKVTGYEVKYTQLDNIKEERARINRVVLPPSASSVLLDRLLKYTRYNISVRVLTSEGEGPFSSPVEAQTEEDVPGPVNALKVTPSLTAVELTWSDPDEPNGVIINYEIAYELEDRVVAVNTSQLRRQYTVRRLRPRTTLDVSVSAYTRLGRGVARSVSNVSTLSPPVPLNVTVRTVSPTSVEVSWVSPRIPELLQWVVYYSPSVSDDSMATELSVNVTSGNTSVVINSLQEGVVYLFEVQAVVMVGGEVVFGNRTAAAMVDEMMETPPPGANSGIIVGVLLGLVVFFILALVLVFGIISIFKKSSTGANKKSGSVGPADEQFNTSETLRYNGPIIRGFPSDTSVVVGEKVLFSVAVTGNPDPDVTWYHNGNKLGPENDLVVPPYSCLYIAEVDLSHSGIYRMYARNSGGTARDEFRMKVRLNKDDQLEMAKQLAMEEGTDVPQNQPEAESVTVQHAMENIIDHNKLL